VPLSAQRHRADGRCLPPRLGRAAAAGIALAPYLLTCPLPLAGRGEADDLVRWGTTLYLDQEESVAVVNLKGSVYAGRDYVARQCVASSRTMVVDKLDQAWKRPPGAPPLAYRVRVLRLPGGHLLCGSAPADPLRPEPGCPHRQPRARSPAGRRSAGQDRPPLHAGRQDHRGGGPRWDVRGRVTYWHMGRPVHRRPNMRAWHHRFRSQSSTA